MGDWGFLLPEETINLDLNPSAETTGNFAAVGGTVTRVTTYAKYGPYSYRVQTAADNQGMTLTLSALANAIHYVTVHVRGTLPSSWDWSVDNSNWTEPSLLLQLDANWAIYGAQFPAAQCNGSTTLRIYQNGAGSGDFFVDGVQVEEKSYWTTVAIGGRAGCEWLGAPHASASKRSAQSRAGGRLRDFYDDYEFGVAMDRGTGVMPVTLLVDDYAQGPGGELDSIKRQMREFSLIGPLVASGGDLDAARQLLESALAHDVYPRDADGWQAVRIWYTGATVAKEIKAHYVGGLEVAEGVPEHAGAFENLPLRFMADDPFWREIGESSKVLDSWDDLTIRYITARLRSTGQWSALGLTNNPDTNGTIYAILYASDGYVYIGGDFEALDGVAGRDYVARYNLATGAFETVGGASDFNDIVYALIEGPDGTIYAGGEFLNCAADADADLLAEWNGSAWSAVGPGPAGAGYSGTYVRCMAFDQDGLLIFAGRFENWAGNANADGLATWDGSSYSTLGAPAITGTDFIYCLAVSTDNEVFVGGAFANLGGVAAADYLGYWDGSAWATVGGVTPSLYVYALVFDQAGLLYIGGAFQNLAGIANADYVATFNGTAFQALSTGMDNSVRAMCIGPDGMVYASGVFTQAGDITTPDRAARWNGASWAHLDVDLPGTPIVWTITTSPADPVVPSVYDIWLGMDTTGAGGMAGTADVENDGTGQAYPQLVVSRSGGTSATLQSVTNHTLGKELLFDYDLLDGEKLTVDNDPLALSILSDFFGGRLSATLVGDDFGDWPLQPGTNQITCFVNEAGSPTMLAYLLWRDAYVGKN